MPINCFFNFTQLNSLTTKFDLPSACASQDFYRAIFKQSCFVASPVIVFASAMYKSCLILIFSIVIALCELQAAQDELSNLSGGEDINASIIKGRASSCNKCGNRVERHSDVTRTATCAHSWVDCAVYCCLG